MRIIVLFRQGSADFRFVIGANIIEVQGTDGLGAPVWLPAKGGHMTREVLLEKALQHTTNAWASCYGAHSQRLEKDSNGHILVNLGKVG